MACIQALQNDPDRDMQFVKINARIKKADWSNHLEVGFNGHSNNPQILALTKIMSESLEKHFHLSFPKEIFLAPQIWGGYASDGNIVAVKLSIHWSLEQLESKIAE